MNKGEIMVMQDEARVNVTFSGFNGDLLDAVPFNASDTEIKSWVTEAVRSGAVQNIGTQPSADFSDFIVERFASTSETPFNRLIVRAKTPFGI